MSVPPSPKPAPVAFIVDDEPMLLDLNESMLRQLGFVVRRFRAAELAYEAYRKAPTPPDLIVTDYSMHEMTGMDLLEACRKLHPGQKFLLVSGTVTAGVFQNSPVKPDAFMPKPYAMDEFALAVRSLTGVA
jgi:DNA-binding NtrC family response regulator